jgi:lysophospholipase L1-like esterase
LKSQKNIYKFACLHHFLLLAISIIIICIASCYSERKNYLPPEQEGWIASWAAAQQLVEPNNVPPAPGLSNNTLRQVVQVSIGGKMLRVRFSNEYSTSPVTIKSASIALSTGKGAIDPATDHALRFENNTEVIIKLGATVTTDPVDLPLQPRSRIAITIYFGSTSPDVTGHPGSRTTSYLCKGNRVKAADPVSDAQTDHWYMIDSVEVPAKDASRAVVILGDSITDGRGSGTNMQNRWTDELFLRLHENPGTADIAVLNMGLGGNCLLRECLGPSAINRFKNDVTGQERVKYLIILEGVNDIGQAETREKAILIAENLIKAYDGMIDLAHEKGVRVYGATIMPFGGSFYDADFRESARKKVNAWIRNSGRFDAVIDMDMIMADPVNPGQMLPAYDTGDHLHPNETGYRMMAEGVDLKLFEP